MICPMCLEPQEGSVLGFCCKVRLGPPWAIAHLDHTEPRFVVLAQDGRRAVQIFDMDDSGQKIEGSEQPPYWDESMFNLFPSLEQAQVAQEVLGGEIVALVG
jgi:hypothetical protein